MSRLYATAFVVAVALSVVGCSAEHEVYVSRGDRHYHACQCSRLTGASSPQREGALIAVGYRPCGECQAPPSITWLAACMLRDGGRIARRDELLALRRTLPADYRRLISRRPPQT